MLIHQEDDAVHFERNQFQVQEFKDNLEYHLGAISTGLTQFEKYNDRILNRPAFDENIDEDENEEIEGMTETLSNNFLSSHKILIECRSVQNPVVVLFKLRETSTYRAKMVFEVVFEFLNLKLIPLEMDDIVFLVDKHLFFVLDFYEFLIAFG